MAVMGEFSEYDDRVCLCLVLWAEDLGEQALPFSLVAGRKGKSVRMGIGLEEDMTA